MSAGRKLLIQSSSGDLEIFSIKYNQSGFGITSSQIGFF